MSDTFMIKVTSRPLECIKSYRIGKGHFSLVVMAFVIIVVAMLSGCKKSKSEPQVGGKDETLRFVFLADSRGDSLMEPVNTPVLTAIISQIASLSPKPSFVIFGGDMSYRGYIGFSYTFEAWKDLFTPLTGNGIPLYTAIGNHELYHERFDLRYILANQQAYQSAFPENPSNGPAGYEHLTYSFTSPAGNSFFAVLDPYYLTKDTIAKNLGGNIDSTQITWLKAQVAQTGATHKFLFIHTPYYYVTNDTNEPSLANQSFTTLWAFLDANRFDFYACGHEHLYSRKTIDSNVLPNPQTSPPTSPWQNNIVQLLCGTCGAIITNDSIDPDVKIPWNVHNDFNTYYFSVIDISGSTVTVNSYRGNTGTYSVFDTFTIIK
jgi:hypothetical protein